MKLVVLDGYTLNPGDLSWEELEKLGDLTVYDRTPEDKILERIGDAELVFTNKVPITKETIEKTNIKYIGVLATGYNIVDVKAAKEKGNYSDQHTYIRHLCCSPDGICAPSGDLPPCGSSQRCRQKR